MLGFGDEKDPIVGLTGADRGGLRCQGRHTGGGGEAL